MKKLEEVLLEIALKDGIPPPVEQEQLTQQERRYLDVLDFLHTTKTLYRILLKRPALRKHTKAEIHSALYEMDEVGDKLIRTSPIEELDKGWAIIQRKFNKYSTLSNRTRNRR